VEIFGMEPSGVITVNGRSQDSRRVLHNGEIGVTVPDTGEGIEITLSK
jgi:hypothetical protein